MADRVGRAAQSVCGPASTRLVQRLLGRTGTRYVREILGRSARHRVQADCSQETIGTGAGAWTIHPGTLGHGGIVYSLGVGNDIGFDLALIAKYGVGVFAFDPTPESVAWLARQQLPAGFHHIKSAILDFDGSALFTRSQGIQYGLHRKGITSDDQVQVDVHRLTTVMGWFEHNRIDLLKLNIEGGEYAVIEDVVRSRILVRQMVVEFHHRLPGMHVSQTERAVECLNQAGFRIFNISDNGKEYSFIRT